MAEILIESGVGWIDVRAAVERATAADIIVVRHEGIAAIVLARAANRGIVRTVVVRKREVEVGHD